MHLNLLFLVHLFKFLCVAKHTIDAAVNMEMILSILLTAPKRLLMESSMNLTMMLLVFIKFLPGIFEVKCEQHGA